MSKSFAAVAFVVVMNTPCQAATLVGSPGEVIDGITFTLDETNTNRLILVTLWGIDAPKANEPYGEHAIQALTEALESERVQVDIVERAATGHVVGRVYVNGQSVNQWMVASGNAWVDRRHNQNLQYRSMQHDAQIQRWGLWNQPPSQVVAPSMYGRSKSEASRE